MKITIPEELKRRKKVKVISEGFKDLNKLNGQFLEEILKAQVIYKYPNIRKAEDCAFFCGCIRFLFLNEKGEIDWEHFDSKFTRIQTFIEENYKIKYIFVTKFAQEFATFDEVKEILIFHTTGWANRGDSWLRILSDMNYIEKTSKILSGTEKNNSTGDYKAFLE